LNERETQELLTLSHYTLLHILLQGWLCFFHSSTHRLI